MTLLPLALAEPRWAPIDDPTVNDLCGSMRAPSGYLVAPGWGDGPEAEARQEAFEGAVKNAVRVWGAQFPATRIGDLQASLRAWGGTPAFEGGKRAGVVCAKLLVPVAKLDWWNEASAAADQAMDELGATLAEKMGPSGARYRFGGVGWGTGDWSEVARDLEVQIKASLTRAGRKAAGAREVEAPELTLVLTRDARNLKVAAEYQGGTYEGPVIPLELYGLAAQEIPPSVSDRDAGVPADWRSSSGVAVTFGGVEGEAFCEGVPRTVRVETSAPARVRLLNFDERGDVYLVWPYAGRSDRVAPGSPVELRLAPTRPGGGTERVVAVAVPPDADFGALEDLGGYCRLPARFGPDAYPADATVARAAPRAFPAGTGGCPAIVASKAEQMYETVDDCSAAWRP